MIVFSFIFYIFVQTPVNYLNQNIDKSFSIAHHLIAHAGSEKLADDTLSSKIIFRINKLSLEQGAYEKSPNDIEGSHELRYPRLELLALEKLHYIDPNKRITPEEKRKALDLLEHYLSALDYDTAIVDLVDHFFRIHPNSDYLNFEAKKMMTLLNEFSQHAPRAFHGQLQAKWKAIEQAWL